MKILYCPPGHDPMEVARQARQKRLGVGLGNWWIPFAVVGFLVIGFTVGPLKGILPQKEAQKAQQQAQPVQVAIAAPVVTPTPPIFCNLPTGGMIIDGATAWVDLQAKITRYRCERGQLAEIESVTPATVSP
jgi:hypothetical protein